MVRKLIALILFLALAVIFIPGLHPKAEAAQAGIVQFWIGKTYYQVDGQKVNMDVAPYTDNNSRTMVPLRFLAVSLGAADKDVTWDDNSQTAVIIVGGTTIKFTVGSKTYTVNGVSKSMDTVPAMASDRVFLPARYVAEALGYVVGWDDASQAVTIAKKGAGNGAQEQPAPPVTPPVQPPVATGDIQAGPFTPKIKSLTMQVGSTTATDDSGHSVDLGVAPVAVFTPNPNAGDPSGDHYPTKYPNAYPTGSYIIDTVGPQSVPTVYVPFIPVAETFGVPANNIKWDGSKLTVYQKSSVYWVYTINSKQVIFTDTGKNYSGTATIDNPLLVKNSMPMIETGAAEGLLFPDYGPGLTTKHQLVNDGSGTDFTKGSASLVGQ